MTQDVRPIDLLKDKLFALPAPQSSPGPNDVAAMRAAMRGTGSHPPPPDDITFQDDTLAGRPLLRISAPGSDRSHLVYYLHGGGYVAGEPWSQRGMLGELSRASGAQVLALGYSLAPEAPFPKAYEEAVAGLAELRLRGGQLAIAGDSAGGGLALAVAANAMETHPDALKALLLFSPWADLSLTSRSITDLARRDPIVRRAGLLGMARMYAQGVDLTDARLSPLFGRLQGLPPLLIQVGSDEALLDDALRIDQAVRANDGDVTLEVWPEMIHVWHRFIEALPEAREALHRAGSFLKAKFGA